MGISAYVQIKAPTVSEEAQEKVLKALRLIEGVREAHLTSGIYDFIAKVEGENIGIIGQLIAEKIHSIENIKSSVTSFILK
ncbi:MAG: Lrp/AsnC ligand binding domain-containing protein [Patescibacteria group bacterium]|nr:Lrp/AsnC ligand binding domain-containing protein [Patescibacteria group bacterium]MDD5164428.1 Lrp/AsnC ligand binding domain-containing protein [Patescibacteria group bacterium]MDD5534595.1 Lrp/AsnC ligand binding domain-containing protein [Patescibacteria group bacterium]